MTELILHMNNYSITEAIIVYQTYPKCTKCIISGILILKNIKIVY